MSLLLARALDQPGLEGAYLVAAEQVLAIRRPF
jgi:hypothetical protein